MYSMHHACIFFYVIGIFTAPVRGIYYFSFCYHASQQNPASISLYRNSDLIASTTHHDTNSDSPDNGSNGVALQLVEGDQVYVMLRKNTWVWDGPDRVTVFTGFLVTQLGYNTNNLQNFI